MAKITIPAAKVRQGNLVLYATSMKVRVLASDGFYNVEKLDPEDSENKGYQRLLNKTRARKLADYIVTGQEKQDAFLPTSIFLATDKTEQSISFNEANNTIEIDLYQVCPFYVVDGQHRIEGLKLAAEKNEQVLDFEVPVNIAMGLDEISQMAHFYMVNTLQKSVDDSVGQRIIARITDMYEVENTPSLPRSILRLVEKGEVGKSIEYIEYLNEQPDSPWFGKIKMANSVAKGTTINQKSFVKSVTKYVFVANNPLESLEDKDKQKKIFLNYWKAISNILDDGKASVLYKYGGVELFCKFFPPFCVDLLDKENFTVPTMKHLLKECFDNVDAEYAGVGYPDWWHRGSKASQYNAAAWGHVYSALLKSLRKRNSSGNIQV